MEIMNVFAYGKPVVKRPLPDNSGTFFELRELPHAADGVRGEWLL
jgi:hypothetical protein